jgi:LacI family transcriptional regulator
VRAGRAVPDDVAVLGVDNTRLICETGRPTLSSIDANQRQVGFEAARLLDEVMAGRSTIQPVHTVPPRGVVSRESTDVLAIPDRQVLSAIRFIREHAHRPIQVPDVVEATTCSRRPLETRFKKLRGRTVLQEIHHAQIELARRLLLQTDFPITQIHTRCGFGSYQRLHETFRRLTGTTPSSYRATYMIDSDRRQG